MLPYEENNGKGIYIHIPFCVRKCRYCDFLSFSAPEETKRSYVDALLNEIRNRKFPGSEGRVSSIFFGGGTPTLLGAEPLIRLLEAVRQREDVCPDAEITLECNPGTADGLAFLELKAAGFNRLSIGLQSANEEELKKLGRIHSYDDYVRCVHDAGQAGFENINTDLIYSLPGQTIASWRDTLRKVAAAGMEHVSAYSLIIEEGTPFWDLYHKDDLSRAQGRESRFLPGEETERLMDEEALEVLGAAGFERYEISNFSLPGKESVHNTGTWLRRDYLGFGLGAASLVSGGTVRMKNTDRMDRYLAGDWEDESCREVLGEADRMAEAMFLGLRLKEGVSREYFRSKYKKDPEEIYPGPLKTFSDNGLMDCSGGRIRLTAKGRALANVVMAEFLP